MFLLTTLTHISDKFQELNYNLYVLCWVNELVKYIYLELGIIYPQQWFKLYT